MQDPFVPQDEIGILANVIHVDVRKYSTSVKSLKKNSVRMTTPTRKPTLRLFVRDNNDQQPQNKITSDTNVSLLVGKKRTTMHLTMSSDIFRNRWKELVDVARESRRSLRVAFYHIPFDTMLDMKNVKLQLNVGVSIITECVSDALGLEKLHLCVAQFHPVSVWLRFTSVGLITKYMVNAKRHKLQSVRILSRDAHWTEEEIHQCCVALRCKDSLGDIVDFQWSTRKNYTTPRHMVQQILKETGGRSRQFQKFRWGSWIMEK